MTPKEMVKALQRFNEVGERLLDWEDDTLPAGVPPWNEGKAAPWDNITLSELYSLSISARILVGDITQLLDDLKDSFAAPQLHIIAKNAINGMRKRKPSPRVRFFDIMLAAVKNPMVVDGIPQTGTALYALSQLVADGHPFPEDEVAFIESLLDGHYEQEEMAHALLEAIDGTAE